MSVSGIDISTYQVTTPSLAGLGFVFVRSSYGAVEDIRYRMHAANVRAAGLVLGAYHFWYNVPPASQVARFLATAGGADLLVIDLEGPDSGTAMAHGQVVDMIGRIHAAGRKVGLYHSVSGYPELGQDFDWVAKWSPDPPARHWDFWQYTGGPIDHDRWRGTLAELRAFAGQAPVGGQIVIYEQQDKTGTVAAVAGHDAHGLRLGATGWEHVKTVTGPFRWRFDHVLHKLTADGTPTYAMHVVEGGLAGLYVSSAEVTEVYDPPTPAPAPAPGQPGYDAGYTAAKAKAIAAAQAI